MFPTPTRVLIIRHGEKLGNPADDTHGGPDLSVRGSARAAALPSLFAPADYRAFQLSCALVSAARMTSPGATPPASIAGSPPRFATPDFIFATKESHHSNRPVETITPLKCALNLDDDHYDHEHSDDDYATVGQRHPQQVEVRGESRADLLASRQDFRPGPGPSNRRAAEVAGQRVRSRLADHLAERTAHARDPEPDAAVRRHGRVMRVGRAGALRPRADGSGVLCYQIVRRPGSPSRLGHGGAALWCARSAADGLMAGEARARCGIGLLAAGVRVWQIVSR